MTLISSTSSPTLAQSPWVTYEDNDPLVLAGYSEGDWQTVSVPEAVGGNLTWTDVPGAELVLYFEGSAIEILHSRGPEGGDFHISLDDMTWPPFNGYAEQYLYGTSIQQFNISPGVHQLVMTNGDGALWIEAIRVQDGALLPAIQWTAYPSNDPDVLYTGMWASMPSADVTQESVMYSFTGERSLSVRFQGTGIRVIYSREYQSGLNLQARVDHAATQSVSHPVPSENSQHALVFDTLPYDEHTLHITIAAGTLWVERIDIQGTLLPAEAPLESSASRSAPLALESTLPLVFTEVSTVEELVSAVEAANAAINEHHVILLTPGTYTFDGSSSMWVEAALIVAAYKTVTFIGMGGIDPETGDSLLPADHPASQSWPWATLAMNPADSLNLLDTQVGSTVRLYNIQLRGGGGDPTLRYAGGGIRNSGDLFLYNSRLEDNQANVSAGAILNFANLTTINTALSDNYAVYGSAVFKWNSASIVSYCSTYEGNAAYIGALNLEPGGSVDLRHSNFIGNETFDEEFDTFADVYSAVPVTLPNNHWSGSVGESVNEHVNRSPQSPTRILYGSFSNEGEPCYVPPPPTLCPTSTLEMQAFGATSGELLSPTCQVPQFEVELIPTDSDGDGRFIPRRENLQLQINLSNVGETATEFSRIVLLWEWNRKFVDHPMWQDRTLNHAISPLGGLTAFVGQAGYCENFDGTLCTEDGMQPPENLRNLCIPSDEQGCAFIWWDGQGGMEIINPQQVKTYNAEFPINHSGEIRFKAFVYSGEETLEISDGTGCVNCTFMIPVTYMFGEVLSTDGTIFPPDPDRLAQFKALIFWVLWIETSGAEYEVVGPDPNFPEVNTAFLRNGPYCMGATAGENFSFDQNGVQGEQSTAFSDPQILFVHHCNPNTGTSSSPFDREFVYLYSFGILNGMLGYERNNALSDPDRFDYWVLEAGNFRYMKAESRDGFGFVESLCGYYPGPAGALEYHVELLNCITQLQPDNQPTNMYKRDVRKAKLAYENYYQYISAAVDDFAQLAQNPDSTFYPIGGSVFLRHVNDGTLDGSAGLVLPVGGRCEEGYCISDPSNVNQQLILDEYQEFILLIRASARASTETVYRPSLRIEYDDDVHEILRGFQWTAWAYSLPVNDLGLPR